MERDLLEHILNVSRRMAETRALSPLLNYVMDEAIKLVGAERGYVVLVRSDGSLDFRVKRDQDGRELEDAEDQVSRTVLSQVTGTGQPLVLRDAQQDSRFRGAESVVIFGLRSIMCVPLISRGETIGAIYVENRSIRGRFSDTDAIPLVLFANQAAVNIENARLFQAVQEAHDELEMQVEERTIELSKANALLKQEVAERKQAEEELGKYRDHLEELVKERTAELAEANKELQREIIERKRAEEAEREQWALAEALRDTAEVLNSTLDIDKVMDHILDSVGRVVPYDTVNIHLLDENAETGRVFRIRGYAESNLETPVLGMLYRLDDLPIYCQMLESKEPIVIADTQANSDWITFPETSWIRSYASAPICLHGDVIGFLNLDSATPGFFTITHAKQLQAFANQAAFAIQNARLYEKAQQEIAERRRAEEELKQYHDHLEELVEERTAELMTAVEQLEQEITERRRAEEQLQRYAVELEQANEELRRFTYIVSHDLRAPLTNLKGFAEELDHALEVIGSAMDTALPYLEEEQQQAVTQALREDTPEALGFIDSSVTRMNGFINALLGLSRLGYRELYLEPIDMETLVQAALETLAHQIEERQGKVTVGPLPEVVADRTSMEQIMGNILDNAVKYLDPDRLGEIEITGKGGLDETTFRVRDNGRGIAEENMDKVFAPFRRGRLQDVPGEGLGLACVQALVRRHGGRIWCESELGMGTTFTFTLSNHLAEVDKHV